MNLWRIRKRVKRVRKERRQILRFRRSLGNSSDDEKRINKVKGKQIITVGLATVATIHAAHSAYQAREKMDSRQRMLRKLPTSDLLSSAPLDKLQAKFRKENEEMREEISYNTKQANKEWTEVKELTKELQAFRKVRNRRHLKRKQRGEFGSGRMLELMGMRRQLWNQGPE
jgi:hypothetical protein